MATTQTLPVDQLVALWHPTDDSTGYMHPELVIAACEQIQPSNDTVVRARFYPGLAQHEVPPEALKLIHLGYHTWKRRTGLYT